MNNAERYHFAHFTQENYRYLLRLARQTYTFRTYTNFNKEERFILWRHDVDFSMHTATKLAQIEFEEGMVATYFLHLHNPYYNLLEKEINRCVQSILALGHSIGLHFDIHYYDIHQEEDLEKRLKWEKSVLEEVFGQEICVFSFHRTTPFTMNCQKWQYAGMINTYAEYFQTQVGYCSDSNGYWRNHQLENVLSEAHDERLQVLTHPGWWQETPMSPLQRIYLCIDRQTANMKQKYNCLLKEMGRNNVDLE